MSPSFAVYGTRCSRGEDGGKYGKAMLLSVTEETGGIASLYLLQLRQRLRRVWRGDPQ
jgi:hypothetical protein